MSQNDEILTQLKSGNRITPLGALKKWGCLRLGARIHDLRSLGHQIETSIVTRKGKRYAEYWM
jgi:hypothetical protein